jgi:hypothetical protein
VTFVFCELCPLCFQEFDSLSAQLDVLRRHGCCYAQPREFVQGRVILCTRYGKRIGPVAVKGHAFLDNFKVAGIAQVGDS